MKKTLIFLLCLFAALLLFASCDGSCHHLRMQSETVSPDCTHEGYILHTCPDCGYTYKSDYLAPMGHSITYAVIAPTCTEVGYTAFSCSVCDYAYHSEFKTPTGHDFAVSTVEPTCDKAGYKESKCKTCGFSFQTDFTAAPGHKFTAKITSPTCTEPGYTDYICSVCGYTYRSDFLNATGHIYSTTKESPTLLDAGGLHHACVTCGASFDSHVVYYGELLLAADTDAYKTTAKGVDLSHNNGSVNFQKLCDADVDYVILRAGFSTAGKDSRFEEYYKAAKAVGLDVGVYLYTNSTTVAGIESDVQKLLGYLEGKKLEYPVYLDMETEAQKKLGSTQLLKMLRAFANGMLEAGYFPGLYTNPDWLTSIYGDSSPAKLVDIWLARHNPSLFLEKPNNYAGKYGMWQYCGSENSEAYLTISGVEGKVDLNICYKDYPALIKTYGYNGY